MATLQSFTRSQFFLDFNLKYTNISNFLVWYDFKFAELTEAEFKTLKAKTLQLPPMPMDMFENIIENIDCFSFSPKIILVILVVMGIFMIASGVILIWYKRKATPFSTVGNLVKLIPSLPVNTPSLDSLLPMLSELTQFIAEPQSTSATPHQAAVDKLTLPTPSNSTTWLQTTPIPLSRFTTQPHAGLPDGPYKSLQNQNPLLWRVQLNVSL